MSAGDTGSDSDIGLQEGVPVDEMSDEKPKTREACFLGVQGIKHSLQR